MSLLLTYLFAFNVAMILDVRQAAFL